MSLSATELSRLHRQRRLERNVESNCLNRIKQATHIKRLSRKEKYPDLSDADETVAGKNKGVSANGSYSTPTSTGSSSAQTAATKENAVVSIPVGGGAPRGKHCRSFSFSSFSAPVPVERLASNPSLAPMAGVLAPDFFGYGLPTTAHTPRSAIPPSDWDRCPPESLTSGMNLTHVWNRNRGSIECKNVVRSKSSRSEPLPTSNLINRAGSGISDDGNGSGMLGQSSNAAVSDTEMPMDELLALRGRGNRYPPNCWRSNAPKQMEASLFVSGLYNYSINSLSSPVTSAAPSPVVTLQEPQEKDNDSLKRMAVALETQCRPSNMSADEERLWGVVHSLYNSKANATMKKACSKADRPTNTDINCENEDDETKSASYWQLKYEQREAEGVSQQNEHDRALRAIQRVLADVTTEREEAVMRLRDELEQAHLRRDETILKLTQKLKELQNEVNVAQGGKNVASKDRKGHPESQSGCQSSHDLQGDVGCNEESVAEVEPSSKSVKSEIQGHKASDSFSEQSTVTTDELREDKEAQAQHIERLEEELLALKTRSYGRSLDAVNAIAEHEALLKEFEEKTASLENAKMIITSLESANGSLARELRAKLKEKEDELATLTNTSADRKRTLDSLATELRELQRQQQKPMVPPTHFADQKALCQMLERNVKALRQAAVQHEARNNQSSVDQISQIVSETFSSLKHHLETWETCLETDTGDVTLTVTGADTNLEAALSKKNDETKVLRKELDRVKAESIHEIARLTEEAGSLKEQLMESMEALQQKGRELSVLRDSLNLEDTGVGYISDDGTDGYETESEPVSTDNLIVAATKNSFSGSLLVHGGPGVASVNPNAAEMSDATAAEIQMLKNEIIKQKKEREAKAAELQSEKESLANAKMIISSLEKANKSMLEDLRSRLQDSNTAIASLLEKSIEHEKTIAMLRKELGTVRQEQEKKEQEANANLAKLNDENLVFSMRLAAKDREVEELQQALTQYEGQEVSIATGSAGEEEDPASDAKS